MSIFSAVTYDVQSSTSDKVKSCYNEFDYCQTFGLDISEFRVLGPQFNPPPLGV